MRALVLLSLTGDSGAGVCHLQGRETTPTSMNKFAMAVPSPRWSYKALKHAGRELRTYSVEDFGIRNRTCMYNLKWNFISD